MTTVPPPLDPQAPVPTLVPAANLVPSASTPSASTPSPVSIPVNTPVPSSSLPPAVMTQQDILIRAGKTFLQSLIPAAIVVYNAGGTPTTAHHGYEAAIISAGGAAVSYLYNNLSTLIGKKKASTAISDAEKLQAAVNAYLLSHGGKV